MNLSVTALTLLDFPSPNLPGWESFSPFVVQVSRALKLARLDFTVERVPIMKLPFTTPHGQLPLLRIGDELVADSTRILLRIERELAPGALTAGLDERLRGEAWLWEEFADTALYPYGLFTRWHDERVWPAYKRALFGELPEPLRSLVGNVVRRSTLRSLIARDFTRAGADVLRERMARVLDALEARAPAQGFWVGERCSVADLGLFAQLHCLRSPLAPDAAEELRRRSRLSAYLDRVDRATQ